MTKEERREYNRAYRQAHREEIKAYNQAYRQAHKEELDAYIKAYKVSHKEEIKAYNKAHVNSLGQTKQSIREKSWRILKKMNLHIDGYEVHHCFGYEDPAKFIYISKSLHLKIHQYLRDNNIPADSNHWMAIRELVNNTDEFTYIKC